MIKLALQRKGQPIVVLMHNNRSDPTSTDDIFMDWQLDEKGVVAGNPRRRARDAGRIESSQVRNAVSRHKRNMNAHNAKPNWRWVDFGVLVKVSERETPLGCRTKKGALLLPQNRRRLGRVQGYRRQTRRDQCPFMRRVTGW